MRDTHFASNEIFFFEAWGVSKKKVEKIQSVRKQEEKIFYPHETPGTSGNNNNDDNNNNNDDDNNKTDERGRCFLLGETVCLRRLCFFDRAFLLLKSIRLASA